MPRTTIKQNFAYLRYVLRHKWFVLVAGRRVGLSFWVLLFHDWTKFLPREWWPYVRQFYNPDGSKRNVRDATGAYDPNVQPESFKLAWLKHQRNKHHWHAWISIGDDGSMTPLPMPERYIQEMVADWMGAGRAQHGRWECVEWYMANKDKMVLHPKTRRYVENLLGELFGRGVNYRLILEAKARSYNESTDKRSSAE